MPIKNKILKKVFLISFFLFNCIEIIAKEPPTPSGDGGPSGPGLPIDGGILYLFLTGLVYGIYKLKNRN